MMRLHHDIEKFDKKSIRVIAVCPESVLGIEKFTNKQPMNFDMLSDEKHLIADKYRQQVKILKLGRLPAQIVIDKDQKVVFKHIGSNMKDIVEEDAFLDML